MNRATRDRNLQTEPGGSWRVLLLGCDRPHATRIMKAFAAAPQPPELCQASTLALAERWFAEKEIDVVLVDRQAIGNMDEPDCPGLIAAADRRPVVVLIREDDRINVDMASRIGASGFYYHDQVDANFVRRLWKMTRVGKRSLQ